MIVKVVFRVLVGQVKMTRKVVIANLEGAFTFQFRSECCGCNGF